MAKQPRIVLDITYFYEPGTDTYKGVCHVALAEEGYNVPGTVMFGTDSHTCSAGAFGLFSTGVGNTDAAFILGSGKIWEKVPDSMKFIFTGEMPEYLMAKDLILHILGELTTDGATYRTLEFTGNAINSLNMDERMTLTNMAIEAGAMNGIIAVDQITEKFVKQHSVTSYEIFKSDDDAEYFAEYKINVENLEPVVAKPHSPDNRATVREMKGSKITKAYIGSCTGGKIADFEAAAKIFANEQVKVPTFIIPSTNIVERHLQESTYNDKSLMSIFKDAGCTIAPPSCAACLGGPEDTTGRSVDGDVVISTTNRNFPGRMGSKQAEVYLASPLTVAASAVNGTITDPREFLK